MNFYVRNLKKHETIFQTLHSQSVHGYSQIIQVPGLIVFFLLQHHHELSFLLHLLEQIKFSTNFFPSGNPCWVQSKEIFLSTLLSILFLKKPTNLQGFNYESTGSRRVQIMFENSLRLTMISIVVDSPTLTPSDSH